MFLSRVYESPQASWNQGAGETHRAMTRTSRVLVMMATLDRNTSIRNIAEARGKTDPRSSERCLSEIIFLINRISLSYPTFCPKDGGRLMDQSVDAFKKTRRHA
jgi:hypothetical protein